MTNFQFSLVGTGEGQNVTVFVEGQAPLVAHSSHPNFQYIKEALLADASDDTVVERLVALFDVSVAAAKKFAPLSERITAANGHIFFDGDHVDNALTQQIVRFQQEGVDDWKPLVAFFENVMQNPQEYSRTQLYEWLMADDFTITEDGMIVGYKGVSEDAEDENGERVFRSINSGTAVVNGETQTGRIKQQIGDVVTMPREAVAFDPNVACSTGLHIGTYNYAKSFGGGLTLEVHVNPRDVVSIPSDSSAQKMRACRYTVAGVIEAPYESAVRWDLNEDEFDFDYLDEYDDEDDFDYPDKYDDEDDFDYPDKYDDEDEFVDDDPEGEPEVMRDPMLDSYRPQDNENEVKVGDQFADRDVRRSGNIFTVTQVDEDADTVRGTWAPSGKARVISIGRLFSRKYRRV